MKAKTKSVVTHQEAGRIGNLVMRSRTTPEQRRQWARMGGRKPNPTYEQIQAGIVPERARAHPTKGVPGKPPSTRLVDFRPRGAQRRP